MCGTGQPWRGAGAGGRYANIVRNFHVKNLQSGGGGPRPGRAQPPGTGHFFPATFNQQHNTASSGAAVVEAEVCRAETVETEGR